MDEGTGELRKLWIDGSAGRLEALLRMACPARANVVLAHPHPLYGGTMHNPVIFHADRELNRAGCTTLRFNFRGAGGSEGAHDNGRGEVDDVGAAVRWIAGTSSGPLLIVGYSFGAWCAARYALTDSRVAGLVMLGLPVRAYPVREVLRELRRPLVVVQGSEDELGSPSELEPLLADCDPPGRVVTVAGAVHLFPDRVREVAGHVVEAVEAMLSAHSS